jgi:hypothetical protein
MLSDFLVVVQSVITLFLMMSVGFILAKLGRLGGDALSQMSQLLLKIVAPCIVIGSLQVDFTQEMVRTMATATVAFIGTYVLYGVLVLFLFRRQPDQVKGVLRFGIMFGNVGFMGLPLITSALGEEATILCVMSLVVFNVANWTYGVALMGEKMSLRQALLNPGVIGLVIGLFLFLLRISLPAPILNAVNYLGDLNTPLAMVVIGGQMAGADLIATFRQGRLYLAAAAKLLAMPVLTMLVLLPFQLDIKLYLTVVILSGCPTAGATSMFAQMFRCDTSSAAQLVTLSTLLSVVTLPLMTLLARFLAG